MENPEILAGEVAAIQALAEEEALGHDEDINILPDGQYKTLLSGFPRLLKQNFQEKYNINQKPQILYFL